MSIQDDINARQNEIAELKAVVNDRVADHEKLGEKIKEDKARLKTKEESIALVLAYIEEVEFEQLEREENENLKKEMEREHFGTLVIAVEGGSFTPSDLKVYADATGKEYQPKPPPSQEAVKAVG